MSATSTLPANLTIPSRQRAWWQHEFLQAAVLLALIAVAYAGTWNAAFIWDDDMHVTNNPVIIGPKGFVDIWTTASANYFPLTLTTFWLLHAVFGLDPAPFHLANVALQAACAVVLWRLLRRLNVPGAWLGAALWALHPVQVESVAWISELKNTQACLFFLLAIHCFVGWLESEKPPYRSTHYAAAILCAVCAILSKASTVMLPVALLVVAWWQTGRLGWRHLAAVLPLFALSALASGWTIWEQKYHSYALGPEWDHSLGERIVIAGRAVWFYLGKLLWPHPLMFIYPRWEPRVDVLNLVPFVAAVALPLVLAWFLPRTRSLLAVALYFGALLFPILGFFNVYFFRYSFVADHFQHLASIGPLVLAGALIALLYQRLRPRLGAWSVVPPALVVLLLVVLSTRETRAYRDSSALWRTAYERNPRAWMAATILGNEHVDAGRFEEGLRMHDAALRIHPEAHEPHYNRGLALKKLGRLDEAITAYTRALELKPNFPAAEHNLAIAHVTAGRVPDAIVHYRRALTLQPLPETHYHLALALSASGQSAEAIGHFEAALRLRPDYAEARAQFARVLHPLGRTDEALAHFRRALELNPSDAETRIAFANALALAAIAEIRQKNFAAASERMRDALTVRPDFPDGHYQVGAAFAQAGRLPEALEHLRAALQSKPEYPEAEYTLALVLHAVGQREAAERHAAAARRLRPDLPALP